VTPVPEIEDADTNFTRLQMFEHGGSLVRLPAASYQLPAAGCQLPATSYQPSAIRHQPSVLKVAATSESRHW